jgi:regulator of PEP synthase PpsR (kinase-PPPase family)
MARDTTSAVRARPLTIVLLSGGTGRTAASVLGAALAQFDHEDVRIVRRAEIRSVPSAVRVVKDAAKQRAVLCHTLVEPAVRQAVVREAERHMVPTVDVLGPVLAVLADRLGTPKRAPGLSYQLNKEYFDRTDAVDFTLAHDDGARLDELAQADVVLVGVSRVAKSVTCFYLAYRGVRAANVPLVLGCEPPAELMPLASKKIIGLSMNAQRLQAVRSARVERMAMGAVENYVNIQDIAEELRYAHHVMSEHGWRSIDVSYKAVEEIAKEVTQMIGW